MKELETRILEECDYCLEAQRQQLFGTLFRDHPLVVIPLVHPDWSSSRILTTTWEPGQDFDAFCRQASQDERDRAGVTLFGFYIGTIYRHGVFHADPHPGNYHFRPGGRVVVFDYGCVRVFDPTMARAFVMLSDAVRSDRRDSICKALRQLGAEPSQNDATYDRLRRLLRSFFAPMLQAGPQKIEGRIVVKMGEVMRDKLALAKLRLPGSLLFLFRIRFGLYAVLSRLNAYADWSAMERTFAEPSGGLVSGFDSTRGSASGGL